jgi:hypothetical protein
MTFLRLPHQYDTRHICASGESSSSRLSVPYSFLTRRASKSLSSGSFKFISRPGMRPQVVQDCVAGANLSHIITRSVAAPVTPPLSHPVHVEDMADDCETRGLVSSFNIDFNL